MTCVWKTWRRRWNWRSHKIVLPAQGPEFGGRGSGQPRRSLPSQMSAGERQQRVATGPCVGPRSRRSCWRTSQLEIWMAPTGPAIIVCCSACATTRRHFGFGHPSDELAARCDACLIRLRDGVIDAERLFDPERPRPQNEPAVASRSPYANCAGGLKVSAFFWACPCAGCGPRLPLWDRSAPYRGRVLAREGATIPGGDAEVDLDLSVCHARGNAHGWTRLRFRCPESHGFSASMAVTVRR